MAAATEAFKSFRKLASVRSIDVVLTDVYASQKIVAFVTNRLVTRNGDGYAAITLPRDEPYASHNAFDFCDPNYLSRFQTAD